MKGDSIPDPDHVARYSPAVPHQDGSPDGSAFRLRRKDGRAEEYLSVNWLEALRAPEAHDIDGRIKETRHILAKKLRMGAGSQIVVLCVGRTREHVRVASKDHRLLEFLHEPSVNDPSHAGIHNLRLDETVIADLIAQSFVASYPAKG